MKKLLLFILIFVIGSSVYARVSIIGNVSYNTAETNLSYDAQVNLSIASNRLFLSLKGNNAYDEINYFSLLVKYSFRDLLKLSWLTPYLIVSDEVYLDSDFSNRFLTGFGLDLDIFKNWKLFNINFETGLNVSFEKDTEIKESVVVWWRSRIELNFRISDNLYIVGDYVYVLPMNIADSVWSYSSISGVIKLTKLVSLVASYRLYDYSVLGLGEGSLYTVNLKISL